MNKHQITDDDLLGAHRHSALHRAEIVRSELCGCFFCLATFAPEIIVTWIENRNVVQGHTGVTAVCPSCGIDSVIGSASGYPVDKEFLAAMKDRWFSGT